MWSYERAVIVAKTQQQKSALRWLWKYRPTCLNYLYRPYSLLYPYEDTHPDNVRQLTHKGQRALQCVFGDLKPEIQIAISDIGLHWGNHYENFAAKNAPNSRRHAVVLLWLGAQYYLNRYAPPEPNPRPGHVYLFKAENGLIKIGFSENPEQRLEHFLNGPVEVWLLYSSPATQRPAELERNLHKQYAAKRVRGEWFALSDNDVQQIQKTCNGASA